MAEEPHSSPPPEVAAPGRLQAWKRHRAPLLAVVAVLVVTAFLVHRYFAGYESTDDAQVDAHLSSISARISGHVMKVNVEDNQYVQQGDVLVELDPTDYQLAVDRARAELASSEATLQSLSIAVPITSATTSSQVASSVADTASAGASVVAAEEQAAAAHAQVEEAEANDARVQEDLERYRLLAEKQEISAQMYAQAVAAARASNASVTAARATEAAARQAIQQAKERRAQADASRRAAEAGRQQVDSARARALAAEADVRRNRAALAQAETNLRYTKIVASTTGQVRKSVVTGMNVQAGQQLLTIVPLDAIWITANFKETQLRQIRPGQRAQIQVDSNGRTYQGRVDSIAAATGTLFTLFPPENATGNYVKVVQRIPVKIVLDAGENGDRQLRPGMNVVPTVYVR